MANRGASAPGASSTDDAPHVPPALGRFVDRYRSMMRSGLKAEVELEVRVQGVTLPFFRAVVDSLMQDHEFTTGPVVHTVDAITSPQGRTASNYKNVRRMRFEDRAAKASAPSVARVTPDELYRKTDMLPPVSVTINQNLRYKLSFASEIPIKDAVFDSRSLMRVRNRVSILFPAHSPVWRVDLGVVSQTTGMVSHDDHGVRRSSLETTVEQMFLPGMTPENMLSMMGLGVATGPGGEAPDEYQYEVEIEHVDSRNPATAASVVDMVDRILAAAKTPTASDEVAIRDMKTLLIRLLVTERRRLGVAPSLKQVLPQVIALTKNIYLQLFPPVGFYLTIKTDGFRAPAVAEGRRLRMLGDRMYEFTLPPVTSAAADESAPAAAAAADESIAPPSSVRRTVADGELVVGDDNNVTYYIFDVMVVNGESVTDEPFEQRLKYFDTVAKTLGKYEGVKVVAKGFVPIADGSAAALERTARKVHEAPYPFGTDGLIFVKPGNSYTHTRTFKWKPLSDMTIDFLARRVNQTTVPHPPRPGFTLHFLFVKITRDQFRSLGMDMAPGYDQLFPGTPGAFFPVQFSAPSAPAAYVYWHPDAAGGADAAGAAGTEDDQTIDGRIVEMRCRAPCAAATNPLESPDWELVRIRHDHDADAERGVAFGNAYRTAVSTWFNYVNPFPIEDLWNPMAGYFAGKKNSMYNAQTAYVSFAKTRPIRALSFKHNVVDLGAGKGQDLGRYIDAGVRNLFAVDSDRSGLATLVQRTFQGRGGPGRGRDTRAPGTTVRVLLADLTKLPPAETFRRLKALGLPDSGGDAVVCNLAVHYFMRSMSLIRRFADLCALIAHRPGTTVTLSFFDGERIHAMLEQRGVTTGDAVVVREGETVKYLVRRLYKSRRLEAAGQEIGVVLPFSRGDEYREFLVPMPTLVSTFDQRGLTLSETRGFDELADDFAVSTPELNRRLSDDDRMYLSLYRYATFKRTSADTAGVDVK